MQFSIFGQPNLVHYQYYKNVTLLHEEPGRHCEMNKYLQQNFIETYSPL